MRGDHFLTEVERVQRIEPMPLTFAIHCACGAP
jgi:hypothetical protein